MGVRDKFDSCAPFLKKCNISVKPSCILKIQNAVDSAHHVISISLKVTALSVPHYLQPAPEPGAVSSRGVHGET